MTADLRLDPTRGLIRGLRAAVLTVPTVGGAVLAHSMVDGCGNVLAIATATGLCWPAAVALLGVRRRLPALLSWVVAAQLVTHLLLEWMCGDVMSGQVSLAHHLVMSINGSVVGAHLGAVLVTAVVLGRADAGLWTARALVRGGARALRSLRRLAPVRLHVPVRVRPAPTTAARVPTFALRETAPLVRRGPPILLVR